MIMKDYTEILTDIGHDAKIELSIYDTKQTRTKKQAFIIATDLMFMFGEPEYKIEYVEHRETTWIQLDAKKNHQGININVFWSQEEIDAN